MTKKIEGITKIKKVGKVFGRKRRTIKGMYYGKLINRIYTGGEDIKKSAEHECVDNKKSVKENSAKDGHILDRYI